MTTQGVPEPPAGPLARIAALLAAVLIVVALIAAVASGDDTGARPVSLAGAPLEGDPFAYEPDRRGEFEVRAAAGSANVLYANSPGGAFATARMVAKYRDEIEPTTASSDVDPDVLEAMVYLESAGRSQVIAGGDPEAASGLTQIVASTATDLLGMQVDLDRSRKLTRQINRAYDAGQVGRAQRLTAERARIDERFDPQAALAGAVRYLELARDRFGADDLAVVSYHMGIGNLERVIETYLSEEPDPGGDPVPYSELYFNSTPLDHPATWDLLASFGDESSLYYWKVLAAEGIMRLYRDDPEGLRELERLHGGGLGGELAFHPPDSTETFADPGELEDAWRTGTIIPIPESGELGYALDPAIGSLAADAGSQQALYRGLRPEALVALIYLAGIARDVNGGGELTVTQAVRDVAYEERLADDHPGAVDDSPLHVTGWSFDIARDYESGAQAQAFQFALDRLRALALIDYTVELDVIHVTASDQVGPLLG